MTAAAALPLSEVVCDPSIYPPERSGTRRPSTTTPRPCWLATSSRPKTANRLVSKTTSEPDYWRELPHGARPRSPCLAPQRPRHQHRGSGPQHPAWRARGVHPGSCRRKRHLPGQGPHRQPGPVQHQPREASASTLAAAAGGGLFWLPAAFVLAVFVAAVNAWVILVEVLR